jgi:hypothetical protein
MGATVLGQFFNKIKVNFYKEDFREVLLVLCKYAISPKSLWLFVKILRPYSNQFECLGAKNFKFSFGLRILL